MLPLRSLSYPVFLLFFALTAFGGTERWTIQGPYGGAINDVQFDPSDPSIVYASTGDGLFRSVDGGQRWIAAAELTGTAVLNVAIVKDDPRKVFVSTFIGIHRSDDRGLTWRRLPSTVSSEVAVSRDASHVYFFGISMFERSFDGGATFAGFPTGLPNGSHVVSIAVDPQDPKIVYVTLVKEGVYKSVDGGATWAAANAGLAAPLYRTILIDPADRSTLYVATGTSIFKSTNGGSSWAALPIGAATQIWSLAISATNPATLVAATEFGVLRSTNGGATWTNTGLIDVKVVAVDPLHPATFLAATGVHLFRSTDGGGNYAIADLGVMVFDTAALAVDPKNPATVYAAGPGGVFKSIDRGMSWSSPSSMNEALHPISVSALAIDALDSSVLYALSRGDVMRSTDAGATWAQFEYGLGSSFAEQLAADPRVSGTVYTIAGEKLYRRTAETKWVQLGGLPQGFRANFIVIDPNDSAVLYTGDLYSLFRSTNAGESWTPLPAPSPSLKEGLAIDPFDSNHLFLSTYHVFESRDGGATWLDRDRHDIEWSSTITFDRSTPGRVYANTGRSFSESISSRSDDGGRTWSSFTDGILDATILAVAPDGTAVYTGGKRAGVWTYHYPITTTRRRAARH